MEIETAHKYPAGRPSQPTQNRSVLVVLIFPFILMGNFTFSWGWKKNLKSKWTPPDTEKKPIRTNTRTSEFNEIPPHSPRQAGRQAAFSENIINDILIFTFEPAYQTCAVLNPTDFQLELQQPPARARCPCYLNVLAHNVTGRWKHANSRKWVENWLRLISLGKLAVKKIYTNLFYEPSNLSCILGHFFFLSLRNPNYTCNVNSWEKW